MTSPLLHLFLFPISCSDLLPRAPPKIEEEEEEDLAAKKEKNMTYPFTQTMLLVTTI